MENNSVPQCPIARGLDSVGDAWSILVLRDAHTGLTRFDQFRKSLKIAPTMLTKRLKSLTEDGLLQKRLYSERPPREEYVLTEAGRDFLPILMLIGAWAHRHCDGELARYIDVESGAEIEPIGIDAVTGAKLGTRVIRMSSD
jgi:DNA-binding HxlR family transcriptional regulator